MAGYFENMIKRHLEKLQKEVDAASSKAAKEVGKEADEYAFRTALPELEENMRLAYLASTAAWYRAYIPKKYSRSHSFYDALEIESDPDEMSFGWQYKDDEMDKPSWSGGTYNVYNRVFDQGRHGGPVHGRKSVQTTSIPALLDKQTREIQSYTQERINVYSQQYFKENAGRRCEEILREKQ